MRGRLLILIGMIILLAVILIVIVIPSFKLGNTQKVIPAGAVVNAQSTPVPYYNNKVLVFPEGTTDWKVAGNNPESTLDNFYCLIDKEWHRCYPIEEVQ